MICISSHIILHKMNNSTTLTCFFNYMIVFFICPINITASFSFLPFMSHYEEYKHTRALLCIFTNYAVPYQTNKDETYRFIMILAIIMIVVSKINILTYDLYDFYNYFIITFFIYLNVKTIHETFQSEWRDTYLGRLVKS